MVTTSVVLLPLDEGSGVVEDTSSVQTGSFFTFIGSAAVAVEVAGCLEGFATALPFKNRGFTCTTWPAGCGAVCKCGFRMGQALSIELMRVSIIYSLDLGKISVQVRRNL